MARMQGKTVSDGYECFAGVDVSKAALDLHVAGGAGSGLARRFANDAAGIAALVGALGGARHLVVFEPTGRHHLALWRALSEAGHGTAPVNPFAARRLAEGLGRLAKTDRIDAATLALIACRLRPAGKAPPDEEMLQIKELHSARQTLIRRRAMVRTQASAGGSGRAHAMVRALLAEEEALLSTQIGRLDAVLGRLTGSGLLARKLAILGSIPGIGPVSAVTLVADLPELGQASRAEIAALSGTAPMTRESGTWKGRSRTRGGRKSLRAALHMPAIAAMTHNPDLKAFARRLRQNGKHPDLVITAVLRKLLVLANTLLADNREWTTLKS